MMRSDCYRLLAACFYEPEKDVFLEEKVCDHLADLLTAAAPSAVRAARKMAAALQEIDQQTLSRDHATLFLGPFELVAAPYGSVYLEEGRRVMGDSTMEVARWYRREGVAIAVGEPPDHIAIELEFLSFLARNEALAASGGLDAEAERCRQLQARFLTTLLQPWVPAFCAAIRAGTANRFYRALADCLEEGIAAIGRLHGTPESAN